MHTKAETLECLRWQHSEGCGIHCPKASDRGGMCPVIGYPDQYENYMALLRDPAIPEERSAPLLAILERCTHMDNSMCSDCPDFPDCGGSFPGKVLEETYKLCCEFGLYESMGNEE